MEDRFGYEAYSSYTHANTKEKATNSFQPVFNNVNQYKLGVKKYTKYGVVLDLSSSVDQSSGQTLSGADYKDLHTSTHALGIQMDLWKDFMGSVTRANFSNVSDIQKKDQLQADISRSVLTNNVRKLYWAIVANNQKTLITQNLYTAANKQAADARKRKANSISDKAEVARFESLVHQRKGQLLLLEFEKEALYKNLRDLFPELNGKKLVLGEYNLGRSTFELLECTQKIDQMNDVPYNYTKYDEIVSLLKSVQTRQKKVDQKYDDIDLKLNLSLKQVGVSSNSDDNTNYYGDYQESVDDISDNDRSAMSASLLLTIPFGEDRKGTAAVKEAYTDKQFDASISQISSNVKSTHEQISKSVKILSQIIQEQRSNSKQLAIRVKEMKKKYSQARIPEYALIQDEDSLLQSDISVVDTQLQIVNTVLDYTSVFNTLPCAFNRK